VQTAQGKVRGIVEEAHRSFIGLSFAQPPVGQLRWKSPQPPLPYTEDIYNATTKRDDCVQPNRRLLMSEDCLYLNIYTPRTSEPGFGTWPVMVFFYGGGFVTGGIGLIPLYNGKGIVEFSLDTVVVFTNYRIGALGFSGSDELAADNSDGSTGNYGLQDQRQALIYVQQNIRAFGGDPTRVMIFGESAGSWSVHDHLVLRKSDGLYHAAIMESGTNNGMFVMNRTQYNAQWEKFSGQMGCNRNPACMRNFTWEELLDGTDDWGSDAFGEWGLRIDGVEISEDPRIAVQNGRFNRVPVIIGSNSDEVPGRFDQRNLTSEEYAAWIQSFYGPVYGPQFATQLLEVYTVGPSGKFQGPWFAIQAMRTHEIFTCSARRNARWMSAFTDVYLYEFHQTVGLVQFVVPEVGVFHASELVYTLNFRPFVLTIQDRRVAQFTQGYWTRFTANGDPNERLSFTWDQYVAGSNEETILIQAELQMVANLYREQCDLWDQVQSIPPPFPKIDQLWNEIFVQLAEAKQDFNENM